MAPGIEPLIQAHHTPGQSLQRGLWLAPRFLSAVLDLISVICFGCLTHSKEYEADDDYTDVPSPPVGVR